jgi:hypothetical protein
MHSIKPMPITQARMVHTLAFLAKIYYIADCNKVIFNNDIEQDGQRPNKQLTKDRIYIYEQMDWNRRRK